VGRNDEAAPDASVEAKVCKENFPGRDGRALEVDARTVKQSRSKRSERLRQPPWRPARHKVRGRRELLILPVDPGRLARHESEWRDRHAVAPFAA